MRNSDTIKYAVLRYNVVIFYYPLNTHNNENN